MTISRAGLAVAGVAQDEMQTIVLSHLRYEALQSYKQDGQGGHWPTCPLGNQKSRAMHCSGRRAAPR